jgi:ATP-binding cassette subfamily F protein 3
LLAAMLFRGDDVEKPASVLSGGERKRLVLTRLLLEGHNVLLLDEPTNHLDLPSRETLEMALSLFEGTLVIVSHDRYLLDRLCDRVLWIEDGAWHLTGGGFEEALSAKRERERRAEGRRLAQREAQKRVEEASRRPVAGPMPELKPRSRFARVKTEELESRIIACEERIAALNVRFADPAVFKDAEKLRRVREGLDAAHEELADLEAEWRMRG